MIQAGGATLDSLRRAMLLPLDILRLVDEEIQQRIEILIQQGEITEAEGMHWLERLLAVSPRVLSDVVIEREIKRVIDQQDIPTRVEFMELIKQINHLTEKLDRLDS